MRAFPEFWEYRETQTSSKHLSSSASPPLCGQPTVEDCAPESGSFGLPIIFFVGANFLIGAGGAMYFTLSVAYLDDNTRKNKAPFMIAVSLVIRMLGPSTGFVIASYSLAHFVEPSLTPAITNKDPRWIGAWWMGYVVFGTVLCLLAPVMAAFPPELPRSARRRVLSGGAAAAPARRSFRDFLALVGRLLRNRVYMLNTFSSVFFIFGYSGLWNFMPKYMETLFRQTSSSASFLTGTVGLVFSALGVLASGWLITQFRPRPRLLAAWNIFAEVLDVVGYSSWAFLGCPANRLQGTFGNDGSWNLTAPCNSACDCGREMKYTPICVTESFTTFYSPCHAGCYLTEVMNDKRTFSNCSCALNNKVVDGACITDCSGNFTVFLIMQSILRFLQATGKSGNMLLQFRSVNEDDKSMSIAIMEILLCCLVYIPAPIVFGIILDSVCLVWGETCGHSGNCWFYDGHMLRYVINFTASGCLALGLILDIGVWFYAKDLQVYDNDLSTPEAQEPLKK
ncbi:Solute carrier organic anion transporter family member [Gryllus bimaculatus]|nr:Solute carrier organic anion transporter family member [Gryllus bimaculatus]